jgi:hypothetical protein
MLSVRLPAMPAMTTLFHSEPFPKILECGLLTEHKDTDLIDLGRNPSACNECKSEKSD